MRFLCVALLLVILPTDASAQVDDPAAELPNLFELISIAEGEPLWAGSLRLRSVEDAFKEADRMQWGTYVQLRAFAETSMGQHADALAWWDRVMSPRRDSVGTLPDGARAVNAFDYLVESADTTQVIMINERHHAANDRLLTLSLLEPLYEKGYRYFAAESFLASDSLINARAYPTAETGAYTTEPAFAQVVREALELGYTLVPYEMTPAQRQQGLPGHNPQQRRDSYQARNLKANIFEQDPDARVLVHAGYSHIVEEATDRFYPMAVYLQEMTGIDPLTVDQTRLSERSEPAYEHPDYRAAHQAGLLDQSATILIDADGTPLALDNFAVDVQVLTPRTRYGAGRPNWMDLKGQRAPVDVAVPECRDQWCYLEARLQDEPSEAVPLDRTEVAETDSARLFLPEDQPLLINVYSRDGRLLREIRDVDTSTMKP